MTQYNQPNEKQKEVVDKIVDQGMSQTKAYMSVYDCKESSAASACSQLMDKPYIKDYIDQKYGVEKSIGRAKLRNNVNRAIRTLTDIIEDDTAKHHTRLQAAKELLDRVGISKIEDKKEVSQDINLNADFSDKEEKDVLKSLKALTVEDEDAETNEEADKTGSPSHN